jgi:hypothetical protein
VYPTDKAERYSYSGAMPEYRFIIHGGRPHDDLEGLDLPDDAAACREGTLILRDVKKTQETGRQAWAVEVIQGDRQVCIINWPG